jgi:exonuclease III
VFPDEADAYARLRVRPNRISPVSRTEHGRFKGRGLIGIFIHFMAMAFAAFSFAASFSDSTPYNFNKFEFDSAKSRKPHRWKYRTHKTRSSRLMITTLVFAILTLTVNAQPNPVTNSLTIWTLNISGGHNAETMEAVHNQVKTGQPDIFVLSETKSEGGRISRAWPWEGYQIRESKGLQAGKRKSKHAGVLVGIRSHLPITLDHEEIEGLEGRVVAVTVKVAIRNKGVKFKIIGIYAPARSWGFLDRAETEGQTEFYGKLGRWIANQEERHWIMAGDMNVITSVDDLPEAADNNHIYVEGTRAYESMLQSTQPEPAFDWWGTRERDARIDYTRKGWHPRNRRGSIIDRIASTPIFTVDSIHNQPDPSWRVPHTDHFWVTARATIPDMKMLRLPKEQLQQWVGRRIQRPKINDKETKFGEYKEAVQKELEERASEIKEIVDEKTFETAYRQITSVVNKCGREVFGTRTLPQHRPKARSREMGEKAREAHQVGSIIRALKTGTMINLRESNPPWLRTKLREMADIMEEEEVSMEEAAKLLRKRKWRELYKTQKEEAERRHAWRTKKSMQDVLNGASLTKRIARQERRSRSTGHYLR